MVLNVLIDIMVILDWIMDVIDYFFIEIYNLGDIIFNSDLKNKL